MEIRIRETGAVLLEADFRSLHPNTSFPLQLTEDLLDSFGADIVFEGPQAQPTRYQVAFRDGVEQINGKWFTKYSVADMSVEAAAAVDSQQAAAVRLNRNQRIASSDWTQLDDTPIGNAKKLEWATYRQALRDIPSQSGFPWDVTWPEQPA